MNWQDTGFLLSQNKYNENSSIAEFYTKNYGKISGIIFGASSKKIKNYLLLGNKFHLNFNSRNEGKIGTFKVEIDKIYTPIYLENKKKLHCIIYAMYLLKILTADNQENKKIYDLIDNFFIILSSDNWLINFIYWELNFFKIIGYDIDFKNYADFINIDGDNKFVVKSVNKIIPNFLINKNISSVNNKEIINGFKIVGDYLDKTILKPNNINYPQPRNDFLNLFK